MLLIGNVSAVDWPNITLDMKSDTIADTSAMNTKVLSNPWFISSKTNITPASGALNAAVIPTADPTRINLNSSVFDPLKRRATPFPAIPPIWTDGPSGPSESPPNAVRTPAAILEKRTFTQLASMWPFTSAYT